MKKYFLKKVVSNENFGLILSAIILFTIISIFSEYFLTPYNIFSVSRTLSLFAFIGLTQAVALAIGHLNMSVGAIAGLSTVAAGYLMDVLGLNIWIGIISAIIVGIACGVINGLLITRIGINSFVVTLITMFVYTGINYGLTQGYSFVNIPESFTIIGRGKFFGIPIILIFTIVVFTIMFLFYKYNLIGRRSLALGQNIETTIISGINTDKIIIFTHALSGFIASVGALLFISKMGSAAPVTGKDWLITSFAVSIIGGTALSGGSINVFGILIGAVIFEMIKNGLVLLKFNVYWQQAFIGLIVLLAIGIGRIKTFYSERRSS